MTLVSPGVEIQIIDESVYVPAEASTLPLIFIATAADKTSATGTGLAEGTTSDTADEVLRIASQRELAEKYGLPSFESSAAGNPIQGSEISEYGLLAGYSFLAASSNAYFLRADVDLNQLSGSSSAPVGDPANGTYWLDATNTKWGIFEWDEPTQDFLLRTPRIITSTDDLSGGIPAPAFGSIGDYAIRGTSSNNRLYFKNKANTWVHVGSSGWKAAWATVRGTVSNPTISTSWDLVINSTTVTTTGTTLASLVSDINGTSALSSAGISAAAVSGKLEIYSTSANIVIGSASTDSLITALGIEEKTYYQPTVSFGKHTQIPAYETSDSTPRPTGSIWIKTSTPNNGANFVIKKWSSGSAAWVNQVTALYATNGDAITAYATDGDASTISTGTLYVQYNIDSDNTVSYRPKRWAGNVPNTVTGTNTSPSFTNGHTFTINGTTVTLSGTTAAAFVAAISAASISGVSGSVETSGAVSISHATGGELVIANASGTALSSAGITADTYSNWESLDYTISLSAPTDRPETGTLWYDTNFKADIMQHDGTTWVGYQNITTNSTTDPAGPIIAAAEPEEQSDGTALVENDLWIDTSDLDNYAKIYRYDGSGWVLLDTTDQTTRNGVIFADARNSDDGEDTGSTNIEDLLVSDYLDPDAPDPALYPRGMLLFNTRISGQVVKEFHRGYINTTDWPSGNPRMSGSPALPTYQDRWVLKSGLKADGSLLGNRRAQRAVVVASLKAAINGNQQVRDPVRLFTLLACPGYPEVISDLVALNVDRKETAFIIGDTPLRLEADTTTVTNWMSNAAGAATDGEDGLITANTNVALFYPNGLASTPTGQTVAVPASHAMLRTFAYNDAVAYPWFAPAGTRRGVLTNLANVGYVNSEGDFVPVGLTNGQRDAFYSSKLNLLQFTPGVGLINDGNKTLQGYASATDRINAARLVCYLRRQLDLATRPFLHEPNDKITRDEVKGVVERLMNDLVAKRALYDYLVVCDNSNNTNERIDRNELWIDVAIEPVKNTEFIYVPLRIKNTGEIGGAGA